MSDSKLILDIDMGNSSMKYRCGLQSGRLDYAPQDTEFTLPDVMAPVRVRVSSVLDASHNDRLVEAVSKRWDVECEFARSSERCAGVQNGYTEVAALGVDRWLAVLAAYDRFGGPVLVADLGTAATLDFVTAEGKHLGGFIVPGTGLMRRSLLQDTAAIRYVADESLTDLSPGTQTRDAVERGVLLALVQLVSGELERFNRLCDHNARLALCGGDAERVAAHLDCDYQVLPHLVLDGLRLADFLVR